MAQAQLMERTEFFESDTQGSNRLTTAQERLARAFERLDHAVEHAMNRPAPVAVQDDSAIRQQYVTLVEDYHSLLTQYETMRSENEQLQSAWLETDQQYQQMKATTGQVSEKLDRSIEQLQLVLEA